MGLRVKTLFPLLLGCIETVTAVQRLFSSATNFFNERQREIASSNNSSMSLKLLTAFLILLFFLDLFSISDGTMSHISSAVEILSDSGYFSMGLTLQLANDDLSLEDWQELTIFAPSDQGFSKFGQPSLQDIKYQLSPTRLSVETLRNLPNGGKIPTLRPNSSLVITKSLRFGAQTSINNVVIRDSPVFDDGFIVIYGAEGFFTSIDSNLNSSSSSGSIPIPSSGTRTVPSPNFTSDSSQRLPNRSKLENFFNIFESASSFLLSRGFVIMATFLALQLEESSENDTRRVTLSAPIDEAIPNSTTKFSDYVTIFRGHVINRLPSWKDLQKLAWEGSTLQTVLKENEIELSKSEDILLFNGTPLIYPDLYVNEHISVHDFNQMIKPKEEQATLGEYISVKLLMKSTLLS